MEAAVNVKQAGLSGLALTIRESEPYVHYVLYDPDTFKRLVKGDESVAEDVIYGFMEVEPHNGVANNASEVKAAAARKGYGPMMYDMVMSDSDGGIMSDRGGSSPSAKKVWQHYALMRHDVESTPLDDVSAPRTPQKTDDAHMVDDPLLDQSYDTTTWSVSKDQLVSRHEKVMKELGRAKRAVLEDRLYRLSFGYFARRYSNG